MFFVFLWFFHSNENNDLNFGGFFENYITILFNNIKKFIMSRLIN